MNILGWIVFGLIVGAVARFLMPGRQPMGFIMTTVLGIVGAFVGGAIENFFHGVPLNQPAPAGWLGAILGAFLLLFVYGVMARRTTNV